MINRLTNLPLGVIDSFGVYGSALHYGMIIAFVGSAFLIFLYLWFKGRLGMDEDASLQMMKDDKEGPDGSE